MVRISKQEERRSKSPRRPSIAGSKTGPLKDNLPKGYKEHANASSVEGPLAVFIPKIK